MFVSSFPGSGPVGCTKAPRNTFVVWFGVVGLMERARTRTIQKRFAPSRSWLEGLSLRVIMFVPPFPDPGAREPIGAHEATHGLMEHTRNHNVQKRVCRGPRPMFLAGAFVFSCYRVAFFVSRIRRNRSRACFFISRIRRRGGPGNTATKIMDTGAAASPTDTSFVIPCARRARRPTTPANKQKLLCSRRLAGWLVVG